MHPAWQGHISGLAGEKMLRGKKTPYLFLLRKGELENDYYVTFVAPDFTIHHQPFVLMEDESGWNYENGGPPPSIYLKMAFNDIIHCIMHCNKVDCIAFRGNA